MDARIPKPKDTLPTGLEPGPETKQKRRGRKPSPSRPDISPDASDLELASQIEKIKQELALLEDLRPGSLSEQYNVCGNPGCQCKADPPQKHGPYYQISFTRKGRSSTKFVRKEDAPAIRQELANYERLKTLIDIWVDLATELSNRRLARK